MKLKTVIYLSLSLCFFAKQALGQSKAENQEKLTESIKRGKPLFETHCAGCHKADGSGYVEKRLAPPLAQSDYLLENKSNGIRAILFGVSGKIVVNDIEYDRQMAAIEKTDQEIADILNYIRNTWENEGEFISAQEVKEARDEGPKVDKDR